MVYSRMSSHFVIFLIESKFSIMSEVEFFDKSNINIFLCYLCQVDRNKFNKMI